jgi:hypothetical protein
MANEPIQGTQHPYRFEFSTDGCDEVLTIFSSDPERPPITIDYWTGHGVANSLTELFPYTPGLRRACEKLLTELETALASHDPHERSEAEREHELIAGLRVALTMAESVDSRR